MFRSAEYLSHVRRHPCCICASRREVQAHHIGRHGTSIKADDTMTVPLCALCHEEWHRTGRVGHLVRKAVELEFWRAAALAMGSWIRHGGPCPD